jgi:tungstate transport system ATP-binding protein
MTPPPLYRLDGIRKRYGDRLALDVPALSLREGALYLLTGENGSGKSTMLQILAFLLPPSAGVLAYRGNPVEWREAALLPLRRQVTLLHQSPHLFDRSVADNVGYALKVRGTEEGAAHRRVVESLEAVGLSGFGARRASRLSGGERQRVALARALALSPRALLLDEPFSGVDKPSAAVIRDVIATLPARGTTVVLATHDPAPLRGQADGTLRLYEGALAGTGGADDG